MSTRAAAVIIVLALTLGISVFFYANGMPLDTDEVTAVALLSLIVAAPVIWLVYRKQKKPDS
jgi:hypothetical protein